MSSYSLEPRGSGQWAAVLAALEMLHSPVTCTPDSVSEGCWEGSTQGGHGDDRSLPNCKSGKASQR